MHNKKGVTANAVTPLREGGGGTYAPLAMYSLPLSAHLARVVTRAPKVFAPWQVPGGSMVITGFGAT